MYRFFYLQVCRLQPAKSPTETNIGHVPCDIVLVIDVSGSMLGMAPAPMNDDQGNISRENFGLSVLDLTKHAARTIIETLDEGDRLGVATFSNEAMIIQELIPMTKQNKKLATDRIKQMEADGQTNLWHGIRRGLELFKGNTDNGSVPAVMVLTDGQPNHGAPDIGYIPSIQSLEILRATIHTFGFGYNLESGLLKSIAEIGGGNYSFIPDAGMIGTVFIHSVAHLQSTYATRCSIEITSPAFVTLRPAVGQSIGDRVENQLGCEKLTINLGNLQYGQSRDIYLKNTHANSAKDSFDISDDALVLRAKLSWSRMRAPQYNVFVKQNLLGSSHLPMDVVAYHQSRSMLCKFLSSFSPLTQAGEYRSNPEINLDDSKAALLGLLNSIPSRDYSDPCNRSIMEDIAGSPPAGQVSIALSTGAYFRKWGCHYFLSLWNAHAKQLCNSFKDPGPQMYNDNLFFTKCRDILNEAFDKLPPPTPSYTATSRYASQGKFSMKSYNRSSNPCFAGLSEIELADRRKVPLCELRKGARVQTPKGARCVYAVLQTRFNGNLCKVSDLLVTDWHPIRTDNDAAWVFPNDVTEGTVSYTGHIYSVLLEQDSNVDAHAVRVGGVWGVTLGHGLMDGMDRRAHPFFGDYQRVKEEVEKLGVEDNGVATCYGVEKREVDGLVHGFKK
ncbi:hint-domain-containing protein [Biscogniauxia marginata]|nr:hint-domain-containing protein [Biscogniauxia marginata]